jgi:hypothetical protein
LGGSVSSAGTINSLTWTGDDLVAAGFFYYRKNNDPDGPLLQDGFVNTSKDGITWSQAWQGAGTMEAVTRAGDGYVAVGGAGAQISRSPLHAEGIVVPPFRGADSTIGLADITWTGTQLVAVGRRGAIFTLSTVPTAAIADGNPGRTSTLRITRNLLFFSWPDAWRENTVWAAVYTPSGRIVAPARSVTLHKNEGRLAIGQLPPGQYVLDLQASGKSRSYAFRISR